MSETAASDYLAGLKGAVCFFRANNSLLAELDKLQTRKHPDRLAKKSLTTAQQHLAEQWRAVKRQAALQEEVLAKEKGKDTAQPENGMALGNSLLEQK